MQSMRTVLDTNLEARVPKPEALLAEPAEDTVLAALFSTVAVPEPPPREHANRRISLHENEAST